MTPEKGDGSNAIAGRVGSTQMVKKTTPMNSAASVLFPTGK
jgi:hypothetical protein